MPAKLEYEVKEQERETPRRREGRALSTSLSFRSVVNDAKRRRYQKHQHRKELISLDMISVSSATHRRDLVLGCSKSKTIPDNGEKSKERHFPRESRTATAAASARGRMDCNGARSSFVSHKLASLLARGRRATGAAWARRRGGRERERRESEKERE